MRVEVDMTTAEDKFHVGPWWATAPEFVVSSLQSQLEAAQAIWPELKQYTIAKQRPSSNGRASSKRPSRRHRPCRSA